MPFDGLPEVGGLFDLTHQRRDGRNGRGQRTDIVGNAARRLAQNLLIQRFQDIDVAHLFFIAEPAVVDIRKAAGQGIDRMRSDQHRRRGRQTGTAARNTPHAAAAETTAPIPEATAPAVLTIFHETPLFL